MDGSTIIQKCEPVREQIVLLEESMKRFNQEHNLAEPETLLAHTFAPGAYARSVFVPAGVLFVGKIHKHAHLNMLMLGRVLVVTEEGPTIMEAPQVLCSKAGTKRVVYTDTDTVWTTVHLTESTNLAEIEDQIIAKSYEELDYTQDVECRQLLKALQNRTDQVDFQNVLTEAGLSVADMTALSENTEDQIPLPEGGAPIEIADSSLHGKGVFAGARVAQNEFIGLARVGTKRTPLGRYTNHARVPNCVMALQPSGNIALVTARAIDQGEELTVDYRQARAVAVKGDLLCPG